MVRVYSLKYLHYTFSLQPIEPVVAIIIYNIYFLISLARNVQRTHVLLSTCLIHTYTEQHGSLTVCGDVSEKIYKKSNSESRKPKINLIIKVILVFDGLVNSAEQSN